MEWIRKNLIFNRKNKRSENKEIRAAGVATDNFNDEFIDIIVEENKPAEPTTETEKPDLAKESIKKHVENIEEVTCASEADQPATESRRVFSKKPRPVHFRNMCRGVRLFFSVKSKYNNILYFSQL